MRWRDDAGSGSVLGLALAGVVVLLGLLVAELGALAVARARAQAAADLAALAAAEALSLGELLARGDPVTACARARAVAERNGARLARCAPEPGGAVVVGVTDPAEAEARAGPAWLRPGP